MASDFTVYFTTQRPVRINDLPADEIILLCRLTVEKSQYFKYSQDDGIEETVDANLANIVCEFYDSLDNQGKQEFKEVLKQKRFYSTLRLLKKIKGQKKCIQEQNR